MPQATQLVLSDDQSNSVNFDPNNIDRNGTAHFLADSDGQLNLSDHLALSVNRSLNATSKSSIKLETIKSQSVDGLTVPAGKAIFEGTFKFPSNFTSADRAYAYALLTSALSNANVSATLRDLKAQY